MPYTLATSTSYLLDSQSLSSLAVQVSPLTSCQLCEDITSKARAISHMVDRFALVDMSGMS